MMNSDYDPEPCLVVKYIGALPRWANWWPMKWIYCKVRGIDCVTSEVAPGTLDFQGTECSMEEIVDKINNCEAMPPPGELAREILECVNNNPKWKEYLDD